MLVYENEVQLVIIEDESKNKSESENKSENVGFKLKGTYNITSYIAICSCMALH